MSDDKVLYEVREQTAWITLNRPEALNAINEEMRELIIEFCARAEADRDVQVAPSSPREMEVRLEGNDDLSPGPFSPAPTSLR